MRSRDAWWKERKREGWKNEEGRVARVAFLSRVDSAMAGEKEIEEECGRVGRRGGRGTAERGLIVSSRLFLDRSQR